MTELTAPTLDTSSTHAKVARPGLTWALDFAIVGAVSSFLAPFLVLGNGLGTAVLLIVMLTGAVSGGLLGWGLERTLRRGDALSGLPLVLMVVVMAGVGGLWGAFVGFVGGVVTSVGGLGFDAFDLRSGATMIVVYFTACAAVAAAAQLAWFGPAYAHVKRAGGPTWPLLVAAAGTPILGWSVLSVFLS